MKVSRYFLLVLAAALLFSGPSFAQDVSQEAKRHMFRGQAAMEEASDASGYQDAVSEFKQATRLAPGWADAWFNLGVAQEKVGDLPGAMNSFQNAVSEFKQATQLAPDWADAWFNLGVAQEKAEDFGGAMASFKRYLVLAPDAPDAEEVEGLIFKLEYKRDKAQKTKKEAKADKWGQLSGQWCPVADSSTTLELKCEGRSVLQPYWQFTHHPYSVEVSGSKIIIRGLQEDYNTGHNCMRTMVGLYTGTIDASGFIKGEYLSTSTWQRNCSPFSDNESIYRGRFSGQITARGELITLRFGGVGVLVLRRKD